MTKLTIWKTCIERGENKPDNLYSMRFEKEIPVVLTERQFNILFPEIDKLAIPKAPNTGIIDIEGKI